MQAAELLGVTPGAVRVLAHRGRLIRAGSADRRSRFGRPRALYDLRDVQRMALDRAA